MESVLKIEGARKSCKIKKISRVYQNFTQLKGTTRHPPALSLESMTSADITLHVMWVYCLAYNLL